MTKILVVCLSVLILSAATLRAATGRENFTLVERTGEPTWFFVFETSKGKFWIRRDGMGEISRPPLRHFLYLKQPSKDYVASLYFLEHEGDVFILYELQSGAATLARVDPMKHKLKWATPVSARGVPVLEGDKVSIEGTEISKADGKILSRG